MKYSWIIIMVAATSFAMTACSEGNEAETETSGQDSSATAIPFEPMEKRLTYGEYQLVAKTEKVGSLTNLAIRGLVGENPLSASVNRKVEAVSDVEIADLNEDGQPEVYAFDNRAGKGTPGRILAFNFTPDGKWSEIAVDELPADALNSYRGHDQFRIENGKISRTFPVYDGNDTHAKPTGKEQTVVYTLKKKDEGFHLSISN